MPGSPMYTSDGLNPGDVVMVHRLIEPDDGKPFVWRYFVVITQPGNRWYAKGLRIGAEKGKEKCTVKFDEDGWQVRHLDSSEYPDGVAAVRMLHILKGNIPNIV